MNANTCSIEDVINNTLDNDQRLVPYLILKGHISYRAMKLVGRYMAKTAGAILKAQRDNEGEHTMGSIMTFNQAMGHIRSEPDEAALLEEMGMEASQSSGMWDTIVALVQYANKLNFDCQEILDPRTPAFPEGRHRTELGAKWKPGFGISANAIDRRANWISGLAFHKDEKDPLECATYEQYVTKLQDEDTNPAFILSKETWEALQVDSNVYNDFGSHLVDVLMSIGGTECCEFDELPLRAQTAAIENMRSKLPKLVDSAIKRVKSTKGLDIAQRTAEASKVQGLILGMDKDFRGMLDSSRYATVAEFMYNYIPTGVAVGELETRDMHAKSEAALERSNARRKLTKQEMDRADAQEKADAAERESHFGKPVDSMADLVSDDI